MEFEARMSSPPGIEAAIVLPPRRVWQLQSRAAAGKAFLLTGGDSRDANHREDRDATLCSHTMEDVRGCEDVYGLSRRGCKW